MKVDIKTNNDLVTVTPYGRIDTTTSGEFMQELFSVLDDSSNIIIDFKETEYISSSGLQVLLAAKKKLGDHAAFSIINANDSIVEVFEMTGLVKTFQVTAENLDDHKDIRIIFFDIDGTLISFKTGKVPESTIKAIRKVQEKGIKVVVATGRHMIEMNRLPLKEIDFDGYLLLTGNLCLDKNKEMFAGNEINENDMDVIASIFEAKKVPIAFKSEKEIYINFFNDLVYDILNETHGADIKLGEYKGEKIYQCMVFADDEVRRKLSDMLDHCAITSWHEYGIDIIAKTGGKAAGIQKFLDKEGLSRQQTMAFGDGENDKTMLRYAGTSVAMGNAVESLKADADYVTADVDDDGIAKGLLHYGLIDEIL